MTIVPKQANLIRCRWSNRLESSPALFYPSHRRSLVQVPEPWQRPRWPEGVPHSIGDYEKPLFSILEDTAAQVPGLPYTLFEGARQSFAQVRDKARRVADFLRGQGIGRGDRVAIFMPNLPHYPPIFFGILEAGAVVVTCNPLYKAEELRFQLRDSGARALFVLDHPQFYPTAVSALEGTDVQTVVACGLASCLPRWKALVGRLLGKIPRAPRRSAGHLDLDRVLARARPRPPSVRLEPKEDLAMLVYTGGTTGQPKGAGLTHANYMADLVSAMQWIRVSEMEGIAAETLDKKGVHCFLGLLPWYHSFGMTLCLLGACYTGSRLVCVPDPRAGNPPFTVLLEAIQRHRVTVMVAVPTIYVAMADHPLLHRFDISSLLACGSGGAPLPVELARRFEAASGALLFEGYGLTETAPIATLQPTNERDRKLGTVGFPIPGTRLKIVDTRDGSRELLPGQDGEVAISGPQVMKGYWNRPEENNAAFQTLDGERYLLTGDIGHIDEDGFLVITDRKKDLILVGGFNVYPREVEEVLFQHPKVAQAAVIGLPDPRSGESVKAFVQLKPGQRATEQEILDFCRQRMAGYKRPRQVEIRSSLPTSDVGKVLRRKLREEESAG